MEFKDMRHDDKVYAIGRQWNFLKITYQINAFSLSGNLAQRDTVLVKKGALRHAELKGIETKLIGDQLINLGFFPRKDVTPLRRFKPITDFRN